MKRREFIRTVGAASLLPVAACRTTEAGRQVGFHGIIDCHTHFYDPGRPEGVPWPPANDTFLHRRILPPDYLAEKTPEPVLGTVVVEASSWLEDNQWILDLARQHPFIVGFCGNLNPTDPTFPEHLARFAANPLYRGIRVSGEAFTKGMQDDRFVRHLRLLAERELQLDVNVDVDGLAGVVRLATELPDLRIVVDHLANTPIDGRKPSIEWRRGMVGAAGLKNVHAKVSGLVEGAGRLSKPVPTDAAYYVPWLDIIWDEFGPERLIYGSNWPVSALYAPLFSVQSIVSDFFALKGATARDRVLGGNAARVYRWIRRQG